MLAREGSGDLAGESGRNQSDDGPRATRASATKQNEVLERVRLLERTIGTGAPAFFDIGQALLEINEQRLYRLTGYATFAEYVDRHLGISRGYAYRKMSAARVVAILRDAAMERLPTNEAQARELAALTDHPDALRSAWRDALGEGMPTRVTAAVIRSVVARNRAGLPTSRPARVRPPRRVVSDTRHDPTGRHGITDEP